MTSATACADTATDALDEPQIALTCDQAEALAEIESHERPGHFYLLTGHAGSGKTTLMQSYAKRAKARNKKIALTAPTHKAVAVLARKIAEAVIEDVPCRTIHSLLSLKPKPRGDRLVFERAKWADPIDADIVVIDECSMVDQELYRHIKRHLPNSFVLFVGDPAQLPPVGEIESQTFSTQNRSHLTTIVRQAEGNPILEAAGIIRRSQGGLADWSWCRHSTLDSGHGVFAPGDAVSRWMKKAFTSDEFEQDPDSFRYLAWTNQRVHDVNAMVRQWRYGDHIPTPSMPGERAMFRAPAVLDDTLLFATNEEATVLKISRATYQHKIPNGYASPSWLVSLPTWRITLRNTEGVERTVHMAEDEREYNKVIARIKDEAAESRDRWKHLHDFQSSMARLQSIYALTVHTSQGSTHGTTFIDIPDIRRRFSSNLLEAQQLCYVATTRPSKRLVLVGV